MRGISLIASAGNATGSGPKPSRLLFGQVGRATSIGMEMLEQQHLALRAVCGVRLNSRSGRLVGVTTDWIRLQRFSRENFFKIGLVQIGSGHREPVAFGAGTTAVFLVVTQPAPKRIKS